MGKKSKINLKTQYIIGITILLLAFFILCLAARNVTPASRLYPIKESIRQLKLAATFDTEKKARLYTDIGDENVAEILELIDASASAQDVTKASNNFMQSQLSTANQMHLLKSENKSLSDIKEYFCNSLEAAVPKLEKNVAKAPVLARENVKDAIEAAQTNIDKADEW